MNEIYRSPLSWYKSYFGLGDLAFHEKVKYFEDHTDAFESGYDELTNEVKIDYVLSLFEIGRYQRFIEKVDPVIELVIEFNIFEYQGKNIYNLLLLRKACSYINLNAYDHATPILSQLLNLDPANKLVSLLYARCLKQDTKSRVEVLRMLAIVSCMSGISLQLASIFIVDPFFSEYLHLIEIGSLGMLLTSTVLLLVNELATRNKIKKDIGAKVKCKSID